jgi:hypothetical protein
MTHPFRGITDQRPYPPTGLTTARWIAEVPAFPVRFENIVLTQTGVRIAPLFGITDPHSAGDTTPHIVAWQGQFYLEDGHHRVVRAALTAPWRSIPMRVFHSPGTR